MELISCPECAVVLDQDKLYYLSRTDYGYTEEKKISRDETVYEDEDFYLAVICPVCQEKFASTIKLKGY